jgi:hypothetical protein
MWLLVRLGEPLACRCICGWCSWFLHVLGRCLGRYAVACLGCTTVRWLWYEVLCFGIFVEFLYWTCLQIPIMGFSIVLYTRSLFSIVGSDCLPISQYIWLNLMPSSFLLAKICVRHVNRLSRWRPKYLIDSLCGMRVPFNSTGGHVPCFK